MLNSPKRSTINIKVWAYLVNNSRKKKTMKGITERKGITIYQELCIICVSTWYQRVILPIQ